MDQLLMHARIAQTGPGRHPLSIALLALTLVLALGAAGCGGDDEPKSDEDKAADVAKQYVHTHSNNEEAKCAETLAAGVDEKLCDDLGPLASRVNPEAKETKVTGTTAVVTVTGAATTLIDVTLAKEGDDWKVQRWRGYNPGDSGSGESGSGSSEPDSGGSGSGGGY
jgi:hypothetical protein